MNSMMSYCGLDCDTCPIHRATLESNKEAQSLMRVEIARLCREQYGVNYKPEDITGCDGCRRDNGRLFAGCMTCEIRKCASGKGIENCAYCAEYACEKLEVFLIKELTAKTHLDEIRSRLK
jgi:hypothetical protein